MKKNIIGQIGFYQSYSNSVIRIGHGFERNETHEEPFITLHEKPVYHISKNMFPFDDLEFNIRKVYKWGEYYDPCFMVGMPPVDADVKLYVDTRIEEWYVLWSRISISPMYFDELIVEYEPIAWIRKMPNITIKLAGYNMFIAHIIHMDGLLNGQEESWNEHKGYWRNTWYPSLNCELAFSSIRKTAYQSSEHLKENLAIAPPQLFEMIQEKAIIDPQLKRYDI